MERKPSRDLKRQIAFSETMKQRATEKHLAKIQAYDNNIAAVKLRLKEELEKEAADTVSTN